MSSSLVVLVCHLIRVEGSYAVEVELVFTSFSLI
jgi:hypothetical protein